MKKIITYICMLFSMFACQHLEIPDVQQPEAIPNAMVAPSCVIVSELDASTGTGEPMTRALIGQETTHAVRANFIKVDEVMPDDWTLASQYDRAQASMPSLELAQIVEAEITSSASSTDNYHLRSVGFNPTLFYKYTNKVGSVEPELAHRVGMVGWYPLTYDVPEGLGEEDAQAQFRASDCMTVVDGQICVEFKNKLDGQTDLMVTDYREGRMMMDGFKHTGAVKDWDIQPFGHSNPNTLDPGQFDYINYFTFHHYLSAIRVFIQATPEDRGKATWTTIDDIMVMNQPSTAVVALPTQQARGTGAGVVDGTTATLPSEGVTPQFGEVVSWRDYINFDIIKTPMFANNAPDDSYYQSAALPYTLPTTGQVDPKYLGYALVKPDQEIGDGKTVQLKIFTDAGSFLVDLPETDEDGHLLRPGKIYDYIISISAIGGVDIVIRNDDADKYQALAPYNDEYQGYEYSNCYVITKEMIRNKMEGNYSGFFFRAYVPGRGSRGDIAGDPYSADYKLKPAFVKIYTQSQNKPLEHCELVQGYVRFNLDGRTCINSNGEVDMYPGNTLIAAYDENAEIIWTWHIWVVEELNEYTVNGVKVLDRNLGATWAPKNSYGEVWSSDDSKLLTTYGLYYQWGRKDPTAGPMSAYYDISDMRTNKYYTMDGPRNENAEVYMVGEAPTIENSVQNPIVILSPSDISPVYSNDWLWLKNDDLWGGVSHKKTIYDPCPYGYKVPEGELKAMFEGGNWEMGGQNSWYGASYSKDDVYVFFPYAGWKGDDVGRVSRTHAWMKVGLAGDYQDATFNASTFHRGRSLIARDAFNVNIYGSYQNSYRVGLNYGYTNRTAATTVRCVRYEGEPLRDDDAITHN